MTQSSSHTAEKANAGRSASGAERSRGAEDEEGKGAVGSLPPPLGTAELLPRSMPAALEEPGASAASRGAGTAPLPAREGQGLAQGTAAL